MIISAFIYRKMHLFLYSIDKSWIPSKRNGKPHSQCSPQCTEVIAQDQDAFPRRFYQTVSARSTPTKFIQSKRENSLRNVEIPAVLLKLRRGSIQHLIGDGARTCFAIPADGVTNFKRVKWTVQNFCAKEDFISVNRMWVKGDMNRGTHTPEQPVSLKDSPLLARVRRAMIRQEEESLRPPRSLLGQVGLDFFSFIL